MMFLCLFVCFVACDTEPEALQIQKPFVGSEQYYANLRAYKSSKHQVAFGWFGRWKAEGALTSSYLTSVPDSVDIVSIWGAWAALSDAKKTDMKYVQEVKGTKVLFTIFAHEIPSFYEKTKEGIESYANALCDSVYKYNYDGLDLDYEPGYGGQGTLVSGIGHMDNMEIFVRKLSERLGPASNSGKKLVIDGVPYHLNEGLAILFDYGIVQAYYSPSYTDLQNRFNSAFANGWKPEQYIFTEDFEKLSESGGVPNYQSADGKRMPSLLGMAHFNPEQGEKGGAGTYHMENEYNNDIEYKFLRQAIQIMNPAK